MKAETYKTEGRELDTLKELHTALRTFLDFYTGLAARTCDVNVERPVLWIEATKVETAAKVRVFPPPLRCRQCKTLSESNSCMSERAHILSSTPSTDRDSRRAWQNAVRPLSSWSLTQRRSSFSTGLSYSCHTAYSMVLVRMFSSPVPTVAARASCLVRWNSNRTWSATIAISKVGVTETTSILDPRFARATASGCSRPNGNTRKRV